MLPLNTPLSAEELIELDDILARREVEDTSMDIGMLHGYLTALAIGPVTVMPSVWMPRVWDVWEGKVQPAFETIGQAQRAMELIMRLNNELAMVFADDPASFEPLWERDDNVAPDIWCRGFIMATMHYESHWQPLRDAHIDWFAPFADMVEGGKIEGLSNSEIDDYFLGLFEAIDERIFDIYDYWLPQRGVHVLRSAAAPVVVSRRRATPKMGRNDACPCGSGRKYKKCCGVSENDG